MRKTPAYLKGLAETYARASGDVLRLTKLIQEVSQQLNVAKSEIDACDRLIRKFNCSLEPGLIPPIRAWQGRYGKRGDMSAALKRHLKDAWPQSLTSTELAWDIQLEFGLDFHTGEERSRWQKNSVVGALKRLVKYDEVERLHDASSKPTGAVGRWRSKSDAAPSVDRLLAQVAAAGVSVQQADANPA